ncbi:MAG: hypothetical protein AAGF76_03800 [Pseudomonadota bacterium]
MADLSKGRCGADGPPRSRATIGSGVPAQARERCRLNIQAPNRFRTDRLTLAHGGGGKAMRDLIETYRETLETTDFELRLKTLEDRR